MCGATTWLALAVLLFERQRLLDNGVILSLLCIALLQQQLLFLMAAHAPRLQLQHILFGAMLCALTICRRKHHMVWHLLLSL